MGTSTFARPTVRGKFLFAGDEKLYVRGVTYGTFRPGADGSGYPEPDVVERDFLEMAASGVNAVRVYTVPPRWLLDLAERHGLYVMVGLPWEQHVAFLDDRGRDRSIEASVRAGVRACAGHPAVLCYAIGNEIPAPIVRWHGARRIERYLERLYEAAKDEDPDGLVTYVNYPSTEYLQLPFADLLCFNVYLEAQKTLAAYLARLHNLAGERPLLMAEIGLDSRRNGEETQARVLDWQVRTTFAAGCAGAFLFSWTDEWHRGGHDIEDWDFGLTDRERRPKPALDTVRSAYGAVPFAQAPYGDDPPWPRISVVVCTYNGERTIRDCLEGLEELEYPDCEVIVVDDGSTDATAAIAGEYDVRLITTENRGLSSARNTGMEAATGEIVAYIDDDARPDPHWLTYLAHAFRTTSHVGIGGPNIAPPGDGEIAECVASAPGGPSHVLVSDREAEHIPGCNMSFRKAALQAIGGFDHQFRVAGDDVDVCWRLQQRGGTLGFSAAAVVWHHHRNSIRAYWRQQRGYGRAEALLERKWPEKYNASGHLSWGGRVYAPRVMRARRRRRGYVHYGTWGTGLFQSLYQPASGFLSALPSMPEWWLLIAGLAALSTIGALWQPLLLALPLLALAVGASLVQSTRSAAGSTPRPRTALGARIRTRAVTTLLHLVQPLARLRGRLALGLTPWRRRGGGGLSLRRSRTVWSESWGAPEERLGLVEAVLLAEGAPVSRGGAYDDWDLEVRGGLLCAARVRMAVEEHGGGRQLLRFGLRRRLSRVGACLVAFVAVLAGGAALDGATVAAAILGAVGVALAARVLQEGAAATAALVRAIAAVPEGRAEPAAGARKGRAGPVTARRLTPSADGDATAPRDLGREIEKA